jgi:pantoate--beta-alanine ligase
MLKTYHTVTDLRQILFREKQNGKLTGFIPTMGALHEGHLSLIDAGKKENSVTICSIFINPTQFNDNEDFIKYPRNFDHDKKMLESAGCDYLFLPDVNEIYPDDSFRKIDFDPGFLGTSHEGKFRPGHFAGMAAVVKRLFDIVLPDYACFGLKDYQQFLIVKMMVNYYSLPIEIIGCPIVREKNGLAMSSRNARLSEAQRENASLIYKTLSRAVWQIRKGNLSFEEIMNEGKSSLTNEGNFTVDYFDICSADDLKPAHNGDLIENLLVLTAVYIDKVRLIDNILVRELS